MCQRLSGYAKVSRTFNRSQIVYIPEWHGEHKNNYSNSAVGGRRNGCFYFCYDAKIIKLLKNFLQANQIFAATSDAERGRWQGSRADYTERT